jgi:hypothetical protein
MELTEAGGGHTLFRDTLNTLKHGPYPAFCFPEALSRASAI